MGMAILVALGWLVVACLAGAAVSRLGEAGGVEDAHRLHRLEQEAVPPTRRPADGSVIRPCSQVVAPVPPATTGLSTSEPPSRGRVATTLSTRLRDPHA